METDKTEHLSKTW